MISQFTTAQEVKCANSDRNTYNFDHKEHVSIACMSAATGLGHVISRHTVCRRLWQHGIRVYQPFRGPLTRQRRCWRLPQACQFQRWQCVLFIDESRFQLFSADGRTNVQEREQLRAVFRRLYRLVVDLWGLVRYLWSTADRPYCPWWKSYRTPLHQPGFTSCPVTVLATST